MFVCEYIVLTLLPKWETMKIQRDSKQREYNKELAFDVEAFLQANEGNFVSEFEETLEGTGRAADDCDGYHDFVYSEENVENVKETMSELYLLYLTE